jgi:phosphoserine aminotransferase
MKKRIFFTAGPSQYYTTVPQHLHDAMEAQIPSISHRGPEFADIYQTAISSLRDFLNIPETHHIFFFSSATEIWERLIENCVEKKSYHFVNGVFGERFAWAARMLQKEVIVQERPFGTGFDFDSTEIPDDVELVGLTHNESSNGVMLKMEDIHALKDRYPQMLITLDVVSSVPYPVMDFTKLDAVYFSVQKGFGLPAGLGVCILSPQAFEKSQTLYKKGAMVGTYHNFQEMAKYASKSQTTETPNVMNLYLLGKVTQDLAARGIDRIRAETEEKARLLYEFFDAHPRYKPFINDHSLRSQTLIVVKTNGDSPQLVESLLQKDMEIGYGYGEWKDQHIRIANFPVHTLGDVKRLIAAI